MKSLREDKRSLELQSLLKAVFIAGAEDPDDKKVHVKDYNRIISDLADIYNPKRKVERKKFQDTQKDTLKEIEGKSFEDLIGGGKITVGKKIKTEKMTFTSKNWEKVK